MSRWIDPASPWMREIVEVELPCDRSVAKRYTRRRTPVAKEQAIIADYLACEVDLRTVARRHSVGRSTVLRIIRRWKGTT
jgi:transposase-like protein